MLLAMSVPRLKEREQEVLLEASAVTKQTAALELLIDTRKCERSVASWTKDISEDFHFTRLSLISVQKSRAQNLYPSSMDIYPDSTVASTWNTWRSTRIRLLQIIMKCATILQPAKSKTPSAEYTAALNTTHELADDICNSIPFHLGHHKKEVSSPGFSDYPHPPGQAKWPDNFAATGAVGGWLMIPQLAFASKIETIPNSQKQWMLEYLTTFLRDPRDMARGPVSSPPRTAAFELSSKSGK